MDRPFALDHLDHVVLRVRNLEKSLTFYRMLGADVGREVAAGTVARVASNQSIILQERADYVPAEVGSVDHLNLAIRAAGFPEVVAYLQANAAEITREDPDSRAGPTVYVRDPDGYTLEIRIVGT